MFKNYNHLGFNNPYYFEEEGNLIIERKLSDLLKKYSGKLKIDPVSVIELLNKNYILADRTIIQNIQRTPWMAIPNEYLTDWEYSKVPKHNVLDIREEEIAKVLFKKICLEIKLYIGDKKKIGVLLSGGMDSRIVAGALDYLIKTYQLVGIEITGLTWGDDETRDVVYAKEIASRLGWNWKHYTVSAKDLLNNIKETAIRGCEYSPIHLHAIPQILNDNKLDVILAGSYGDSIGRAEYSGKKVGFVKPIIQNIFNFGGLINSFIFNQSIGQIYKDVKKYHFQFPRIKSYMQNELDFQLHYMRRMLNPCMELLTEKMEFYQVFTHPDVFGYMWSISTDRRNDLVYKYMLNEFITKLDDIPWARNGLPFGQNDGKPDSYLKEHHSYSKIIRKELLGEIENRILSDEFYHLGIFNKKAVKLLLRLVKIIPSKNLLYFEKLIWLASLAEMSKIYSLQGLNYGGKDPFPVRYYISISYKYLFNVFKYKLASIIK